jgi:hypothetical protein
MFGAAEEEHRDSAADYQTQVGLSEDAYRTTLKLEAGGEE